MTDIKGKIKILESKIILKTEKETETYIKTKNVTANSWVEFKGEFYELDRVWESSSDDE